MSFKKHISVPQPDQQEQGYMTQAGQLLGEGRAGLESSMGTLGALDPYLYSLAGLTPEYSGEDTSARRAQLQGQSDAAQQALTTLRTLRGKPGNAKKGKAATGGKAAALASLKAAGIDPTTLKGKNLRGKLKKYLQANQAESGNLAARGRTITGFTEDPAQKAARQKEQELYGTEQGDLQKSLSMNAEDVLAADPALADQLKQEQAQLEQAQVGQFGSLAGAQGGTVGAVQNAAMGQRRAEAISNARRENIGLYAGLMTQQGQLNEGMNAARSGMATNPLQQREQGAQNFGNLAQGYGTLLQAKAGQRQQQFQANAFNQTQPGLGESILKGIGGLLQPFKQSS